MANFEEIIKKNVGEDGSIPASAIDATITAIKTAVGNEYVDKERYKAKLTEIDQLKTKQQNAEDSATTAEKYKTDYDALKKEFEAYKTNVKAENEKKAKTEAFKTVLRESGIDAKRIDTIVKVSADAIESVELDDAGKAKNAKDLAKTIESEWADFKVIEGKQGAITPTPPANPTKTFTRDDIRKMTPKEINDNWETIKGSLANTN